MSGNRKEKTEEEKDQATREEKIKETDVMKCRRDATIVSSCILPTLKDSVVVSSYDSCLKE